jgi:hypothetical protein
MTIYYETEKSTGPLHKILIWRLHNLHRPEIADWIESCSLFATGATLLVETKGTNAAGIKVLSKTRRLETLLLQVALQAGLPFESDEIATVGESSCYNSWAIRKTSVADSVHQPKQLPETYL